MASTDAYAVSNPIPVALLKQGKQGTCQLGFAFGQCGVYLAGLFGSQRFEVRGDTARDDDPHQVRVHLTTLELGKSVHAFGQFVLKRQDILQ